MQIAKKVLAVFLAVLFVLPGLGVGLTASAEGAVMFTVVPNVTTAHPGDTITYSVYMDPVTDMDGLQLKLGLPDGLTFGQADTNTNLLNAMAATCPEFGISFYESSLTLFIFTISTSEHFTSTENDVLLTFTCTVDDDAAGEKTIDLPTHVITSRAVGGSIPTEYDSTDSVVTVKPAAPTKAINLVSGKADYIKGAQTSNVWFGNYKQSGNKTDGWSVDPIKWRVLSNADGKLFLLSDQNLDACVYYERYFTATWETSTIRAWLNGMGEFSEENFKDSAFSAGEDAAVCVTNVSNPDSVFDDRTVPGGSDTADKVFLLSRDEAMNTAYGFTDSIEPTDTRVSINTAYTGSGGSNYGWTSAGGSADYWWLRSPGSADDRAAVIFETGQLNTGGYDVPNRSIAVRPAMNVDLGKVLFTSSAVGGKADDGLTAVRDYTGSDWKLTMLDDSRSGFTASGDSRTGDVWTVNYSGAKTGDNEYISAVIVDGDGAVTYYGRLCKAESGDNNTVTVDVSGKMNDGDKLYVFNEQVNGDKKTDYASDLQDVTELFRYKTGDTILYGNYPQSEVPETDALKAAAETSAWRSFGDYSGDDDGNPFYGYVGTQSIWQGDFFLYADFTLDGVNYRAVRFDEYRPRAPFMVRDAAHSMQDENGYAPNTVYYFKYEPIEWRVLDPDKGLVMCNTALDSRSFQNYIKRIDGLYYGDVAGTALASDWEHSDLRAWLNEDFLRTAFTAAQRANIAETTMNNDNYKTLTGSPSAEHPDGAATTDRVFLLSYADVIDPAYGFDADNRPLDDARQIAGSDYAKCRGLYVEDPGNPDDDGIHAYWYTRTASLSNTVGTIFPTGQLSNMDLCASDQGVVPAMTLTEIRDDVEYDPIEPPVCRIGDTYYATIGEAIDDVTADGTVITILRDCEFDGLTEVAGYDITLESGETDVTVTLTGAMKFGKNDQKKTFTLRGNSTADTTLTIKPKLTDGTNAFRPIAIRQGNTLIVESGAILEGSRFTTGNGGMVNVAKNATLKLNGGTIRDCCAVQGGAVYVVGNGVFYITDGKIENCTAEQGGAVYLTNNSICSFTGGSIENCTAKHRTEATEANSAVSAAGGAVYTIGMLLINGGTIKNCTAECGKGGGVYIYPESGSCIMSRGMITGCKATENADADLYYNDGRGGGVYVGKTKDDTYGLVPSGGSITGNTAKEGGGVYLHEDAVMLAAAGAYIYENADSNVYVSDSANIQTLMENDTYALTGNAKIGVTTQTEPTIGAPVIFGSATADCSAHFVSDAENFDVVYDADNEALLLQYTKKTVETPTFTPDGGSYEGKQTVTIGCTTEGATIYYTTDGSEPSETNGTQYTSAITVDKATTVKAKAFKEGMTPSDTAEAAYTISFLVQVYLNLNLALADGSGAVTQTVTAGQAIKPIVIIAADGYYFPADYNVSSASVNGITLTRDSARQITFSGTPTGDAAITLPSPKEMADPQTAVCRIKDVYYATIGEAINDVTADDTVITVIRDCEFDGLTEVAGHDIILESGDTDVTVTLTGAMKFGKNNRSEIFTLRGNPAADTTLTIKPKLTDGTNAFRPIAIRSGNTLTVESGVVLEGSRFMTGNGGMVNVAKGATLGLNGGTIRDCSAFRGGAVYVDGGNCTIYEGRIENCTAEQGGAVYVSYNGKCYLYEGSIENCTAKHRTIAVAANSTVNAAGGAVYAVGLLQMEGSTIKNCTAEYGKGGGVYLYPEQGTFWMQDSQISGCAATENADADLYYNDGRGGAVYVGKATNTDAPDLCVVDSRITGNTAKEGGGVYLHEDGTMAAYREAYVSENTGGNVFVSDGAAIIAVMEYSQYALTGNARIGVTTRTEPTIGAPVRFGKTKADCKEYFISDSGNADVIYDADGKALLLQCTKKEETPAATFNATGYDTGTLDGLTAGMTYAVNGGTPVTVEGTSVTFTDIALPCVITVMQPGDGVTAYDSDPQTIELTRPDAPTLEVTPIEKVGDKGVIPTTTAHQKSTDGVNWTDCDGEWTNLDGGDYYVRTKPNGTALASDAQMVFFKYDPQLNVTVSAATQKEQTVITAALAEDATYLVVFTLDGNEDWIDVENGRAELQLTLSTGSHALTAKYLGDNKYLSDMVQTSFTVACAHEWNEPTWDWTDVDNPTYTATCKLCEDGTVSDSVQSVKGDRVEATVNEDAYTPYTATVTLNGQPFTGTFNLVEKGTALGAYKEQMKQAAEDKRLPGDSDACNRLIDDAIDAIDAVTYDETKSLDENKQAVDAAANFAQLDKDLTDRRAADVVEKKIDEIGDVTLTDESKQKIDDAREAYDALTDEQKALVDNVDTLTEAEKEFADREAFDEYKEQQKDAIDALAKEGDSDAAQQIIADAKAELDALEYDESKTLDENKAAADAVTFKTAQALEKQRFEDCPLCGKGHDGGFFDKLLGFFHKLAYYLKPYTGLVARILFDILMFHIIPIWY